MWKWTNIFYSFDLRLRSIATLGAVTDVRHKRIPNLVDLQRNGLGLAVLLAFLGWLDFRGWASGTSKNGGLRAQKSTGQAFFVNHLSRESKSIHMLTARTSRRDQKKEMSVLS